MPRSEEHTSELQPYTTLFRSQCKKVLVLAHDALARRALQFDVVAQQTTLVNLAVLDQRCLDRKSTRLNSSPTRRSSDLSARKCSFSHTTRSPAARSSST